MTGRLGLRDLPAVVEAGLFLSLAWLTLLLPPGLLLATAIRRGLRRPVGTAVELRRAQRLEQATRAVVRRWPANVLCLQRSLALLWLLGRRGIGGQLRIGVHTGGERFLAHAWIEVAGEPVNDTPAHCGEFLPLEEVGSPVLTLMKTEATA